MREPRTQAGRNLNNDVYVESSDDALLKGILAVEDEASQIDITALARALALNEFDDPKDAFNKEGELYPSDIQWAQEVAALYAKQLSRETDN